MQGTRRCIPLPCWRPMQSRHDSLPTVATVWEGAAPHPSPLTRANCQLHRHRRVARFTEPIPVSSFAVSWSPSLGHFWLRTSSSILMTASHCPAASTIQYAPPAPASSHTFTRPTATFRSSASFLRSPSVRLTPCLYAYKAVAVAISTCAICPVGRTSSMCFARMTVCLAFPRLERPARPLEPRDFAHLGSGVAPRSHSRSPQLLVCSVCLAVLSQSTVLA